MSTGALCRHCHHRKSDHWDDGRCMAMSKAATAVDGTCTCLNFKKRSRAAIGRRNKTASGDSERELCRILNENGIPARRVPLSGAMSSTGFGGDAYACFEHNTSVSHLAGKNDCEEIVEAKRRGQGFKKIDAWLEDAFAVAYRRDRGEWTVTLRLDDLIALLKRK